MDSAATARSVMRTNLITVRADDALTDAIRLLMEHRISGLPVVDAAGALLGMVTEKDMLRVLYEDAEMVRTVADIMTTSLRSFQADAPLADVCDCLLANHFRRVPILEGERLVGLISRADLMGTILEVAAEHVGRT